MGRKPKVPGDSIRDALKKATTEMMTLCLLQERPMYTYELMQLFEERSQGAITFSTLYQTIYRLRGSISRSSGKPCRRTTGCASISPSPTKGAII